MKSCLQTKDQSVYEHGISVNEHFKDLLKILSGDEPGVGWRLPDWFMLYRQQIKKSLLPLDVIEEYLIHHDCGKPYCLTIDENGKRHFPNHSEVSSKVWMSVGGNIQASKLMKMDMDIHKMKAHDIDEFIKHDEAITLLIAGLAEIHANSKMFGGLESESFKIKWKQINNRGKVICQKLFKDHHEMAT